MGRQDRDAKVASSSIALLQERFRELQRIREKRKEKELQKLLSPESETSSPATNLGFRPEIMLPNRPPALSLTLNTNHAPDFRPINSPTSTLCPNSATSSSSRNSFEISEVDTSLHL